MSHAGPKGWSKVAVVTGQPADLSMGPTPGEAQRSAADAAQAKQEEDDMQAAIQVMPCSHTCIQGCLTPSLHACAAQGLLESLDDAHCILRMHYQFTVPMCVSSQTFRRAVFDAPITCWACFICDPHSAIRSYWRRHNVEMYNDCSQP